MKKGPDQLDGRMIPLRLSMRDRERLERVMEEGRHKSVAGLCRSLIHAVLDDDDREHGEAACR